MDKDVVVNVPVVLTGKPEGVTAGGILQQVARTLPVECKPGDIPEKIEVDVSHLQITESLHIKDVKAPAGVQFKIKGRFTAPTTAAGSISYGKCKQKFKATGPAPAPTEPAPTEPAPQDEPPTTS